MSAVTSPPRRRLPPAQRRAMILDAAADVFGERGYAAGGVDAIGARMGISGAAIYRHFARKQDILIALLDQAVSAALADLDTPTRSPADPVAQLARIVERMVSYATEKWTTLRLIHTEITELDERDRAQVKAIGERLMEPLLATMHAARPALPADVAVFQVRACFAVLGGLASRSPSALDHGMQAVTGRVLLAILMA